MSIQAEIHLDDKCYKVKPSRYAGAISNRITAQKKLITPKELATALCNGQTAVCGIMNGNRTVQNFINQKVVMLDFDNEKDKKKCTGTDYITFAEVIEHPYIKKNASFVYKTFSSSPAHEKFRIVFFLDRTLTNKEQVYSVYNRLFKEFPQADISCKDPSRLFFGGVEYAEVNFKNVLEVEQDILELESTKTISRPVKSKKSSVTSSKERIITTSTTTEIVDMFKNAQVSELKDIYKGKFTKQVPTVAQAFDYIKRIDMREVFQLPEGTFNDILSTDNTPSSNVYVSDSGYFKYKCHSSNSEFQGDLLDLVGKLTGQSLMTTYQYLLKVFNITVKVSEEEQEIYNMIDFFIEVLRDSVSLKRYYPNIYSKLNREKLNVIAVLQLFKSYTFYDTERKETRVAIHMSMETMSEKTGIKLTTLRRLLTKLRSVGVITTLADGEIPKSFLRQLENTKVRNKHQYRTNMYEVVYSNKFTDEVESLCSVLTTRGYTSKGANKSGIKSALGADRAQKVFVQDTVTDSLSKKDRNFIDNISEAGRVLLDESGYISEQELLKRVKKKYTSTKIATLKDTVQKFRGHLIDSLQVIRIKVTNKTKEQYPQLKELKSNTMVYVREVK